MAHNITHAYVRFVDNVLQTVPVSYIQKFQPSHETDFNKDKLYKVLWRDETEDGNSAFVYYKAHILILGKSEDDVEEKIKTSRLKFPKKRRLDYDEPESSDISVDDATVTEKNLKKVRTTAKKTTNMQILNEKINTLKSRGLELNSTSDEENNNDSDGSSGANDIASETQCKKRYEELMKKYSGLQNQVQELKEKVNKATEIINLQDQVGTHKKTVNRRLFSEQDSRQGDDAQSFQQIVILDEKDDFEKVKQLPRYGIFIVMRNAMKVNRVHLGFGIAIDEDVWEMIQLKSEHSKFVKDLATAIWSRNVIIHRSLDGKASGRLPHQGQRKALTPMKLNVLKKCFEDRLRKRDYKGEQLFREVKRMNSYLTELINDFIKRELKELSKTAANADT